MEEQQHFWVFDRTIFDQIEFPALSPFEGFLIVLGLSALFGYVMLIAYLDRRSRRKTQEAKEIAWLERWLEYAQLPPGQLGSLEKLAGGHDPQLLLQLIRNPVRFEQRVHEEITSGRGGHLSFIDDVRGKLRFHANNLRAPVVSTRQLMPNDAVRLSLWEAGNPRHYYGRVVKSDLETFTVELKTEAVRAALANTGELELYHLRGHGWEIRFGCQTKGTGESPNHICFKHALTGKGQRPRTARLPLVIEIPFRVRTLSQDAVAELDPDQRTSKPEPGLLLDISEGGFSIVHQNQVPVGHYLEFELPLKRGRKKPLLKGRLVECRPFGGGQWLSRCELKGASPSQLNLLHQVVRMEQQNRARSLAAILRKKSPPSPPGANTA